MWPRHDKLYVIFLPRVCYEACGYPRIIKPAFLPGQGKGIQNSHPAFIFALLLPLGQDLAFSAACTVLGDLERAGVGYHEERDYPRLS